MLQISKSLSTGTITSGGVSQVLDADKPRVYILIINTSDTVMYINFGAAATSSHIAIAANGGKWENPNGVCPVNSINILCSVTGKTFTYMIA